MATIPTSVLRAFQLASVRQVAEIGSGHIHQTFKVEGEAKFVLQRVNKNIFTRPEVIASNNRLAYQYLKKNKPQFLFPQPLPDVSGEDLFYDDEGFPWRLYPLIENTLTIDEVTTEQQAFEAAKGFGALSKNLQGITVSAFQPTLDRFHDLGWRYEQLEQALEVAKPETLSQAKREIELSQSFHYLVDEYDRLIKSNTLVLRVMHNDTKVNNILFDAISQTAVCAIDLDTLMPGYFIYDLGDMVRTFVSPVNEEEKDISKIRFRENIYQALLRGYLSEMDDTLSDDEKKSIPFAGMMMTYIMALRMLADFLRGNTYYHISYPEQNLVRARNQLHLLGLIRDAVNQ